MIIPRTATAVGTMLLALLSISAPPTLAEQPPQRQSNQSTPLRDDPQLICGQLESGLRYLIRPTKEPAGCASIRLFVDVGSLSETDANAGFSHLLEHMVFNGSRHFKRGELIPTMQKLGLGFGGDANAYTGLRETVYMLELPNLEKKTVDVAFTIMRDFADGATLSDDAIDKERGIVVSELNARNSESMRAGIKLLGQVTEGTRVSKYLPIGQLNVLLHGSCDLLRQHYKGHYTPGNMVLIITGDFEPETARQWVTKYFTGMTRADEVADPELGEITAKPQQTELLVSNPEQADSIIRISVVRPFTDKPDTAEQRIADLPLNMAYGMLNLRFKRVAHLDHCEFRSASAGKEDVFRAADLNELAIATDSHNWRAGLRLGVEMLRQAIDEGFSQDEIDEYAAALRTAHREACDTWATKTATDMADQLVQCLTDKRRMTDPQEDLRVLEEGLAKIYANPEICRAALKNAFDLSKAKLSLSGTLPESITGNELRTAYGDAISRAVKKYGTEKVRPFAYETIGHPGTILRREKMEDLGVTALTLSNGVKVNLKPIDFRKGNISVLAAVDGGSLALPHTPGLSLMVSSVMQRGGLVEHSYDELEKMFASKRVSLNFDLEMRRFIFSGTCSQEDLELQCKLLAAGILHPGYRQEGETMLRRSLNNRYRSLETTPEGALAMQGQRLVYGENPLFTIPRRNEVEVLSAQDVQKALTPLLKQNYLEVTIVGDFNTEKVLPIICRTFGALPQRAESPKELTDAQRHINLRPWGQAAYLRYPTQLDKTIVVQLHPAGSARDMHRERRLKVLADIVREKLFDGLRAQLNESYSPRVGVIANRDFDDAAYISTMSYGVKRNRPIVDAAMTEICNNIGKGEITDEEFIMAIRPYISRVRKSLVSPSYWEEHLIDLQSNPQRAELLRDELKDVQSITADEIRALAREVFGKPKHPDRFFVVPRDYRSDTEDAKGKTFKEMREETEQPNQMPATAVKF